jgi:alpha-tubulin suppressor-like RCC1 family protein
MTKAPFGEFTPVGVSGLTSGVSSIVAGQSHTCVLTLNGGVKCWGYNEHGQLGNGSATTASPFAKPEPVDVSGLTSGVSAITIGNGQTCALTSGGGMKCWGTNGYGELGDGTITNRAAPVDVSGLTSGVSAIAAGYEHTCALMSSPQGTSGGGVKCWGGGRWGKSTNPYNTYSKVPVDVSELASGVSAIAAGHGYTCVITLDEGIKCWGLNGSGQLGDGTTTDQPSPVDVKR